MVLGPLADLRNSSCYEQRRGPFFGSWSSFSSQPRSYFRSPRALETDTRSRCWLSPRTRARSTVLREPMECRARRSGRPHARFVCVRSRPHAAGCVRPDSRSRSGAPCIFVIGAADARSHSPETPATNASSTSLHSSISAHRCLRTASERRASPSSIFSQVGRPGPPRHFGSAPRLLHGRWRAARRKCDWDDCYEAGNALELDRAECERLTGNPERARDRPARTFWRRARTRLHEGAAAELLVAVHLTLGNDRQGYRSCALGGLRCCSTSTHVTTSQLGTMSPQQYETGREPSRRGQQHRRSRRPPGHD